MKATAASAKPQGTGSENCRILVSLVSLFDAGCHAFAALPWLRAFLLTLKGRERMLSPSHDCQLFPVAPGWPGLNEGKPRFLLAFRGFEDSAPATPRSEATQLDASNCY